MPHHGLSRRLLQHASQFILGATLGASSLILVQDNFFEITSVQGSSMAPTLSPSFHETGAKDAILWKKWNATRSLQRGDVVFFSLPHKPDDSGVKRVIALGGDTVLLDRRRKPEDILDGRRNPAAMKWDVWQGRVVVPEGHVWVEGDNSGRTHDSNAYGPISRALIRGKAVGLVWPLKEMGSKPWEGYTTRTRVIPGVEDKSSPQEEGKLWWEPH